MSPWQSNLALLVLRVSLGATMALAHGNTKLQAFAEKSATFADPLGVGSKLSLTLAIFGELVCSGLVVFGLATRFALVPVIFTMGVAFFSVHANDPFSKGELAFIYMMGFVSLLIAGPGEYSIDAIISRKLRSRRDGDPSS